MYPIWVQRSKSTFVFSSFFPRISWRSRIPSVVSARLCWKLEEACVMALCFPPRRARNFFPSARGIHFASQRAGTMIIYFPEGKKKGTSPLLIGTPHHTGSVARWSECPLAGRKVGGSNLHAANFFFQPFFFFFSFPPLAAALGT
jgi:hypothetical protein